MSKIITNQSSFRFDYEKDEHEKLFLKGSQAERRSHLETNYL